MKPQLCAIVRDPHNPRLDLTTRLAEAEALFFAGLIAWSQDLRAFVAQPHDTLAQLRQKMEMKNVSL